MADNSLQEAIAALKAGRRKRARAILAHLLRQDPRNEEAWLWLSGAVDRDSERLLCLRQVLAINPNNERARQGVELLLSKGVTLPTLAPAEPMPAAPPEHAPAPSEPEGEAQPQAEAPAQEGITEAAPHEEAPEEAPAAEAAPLEAGEVEGVAEKELLPTEAGPAVSPEAPDAVSEVVEEARPPEAGEEAAPEAQLAVGTAPLAEAEPFMPPIPEGFVLPDETEAEAEPGLSLRGLLVLILLLIILIAAITILLSQRGI